MPYHFIKSVRPLLFKQETFTLNKCLPRLWLFVSDVVVLDNAKIHKTYRTRELIEASGAEVLFLPPYSPDYNPIEHDFANIKRLREYNADKSIDEVINMYH